MAWPCGVRAKRAREASPATRTLDAELPFKIEPMDRRYVRESGLWLRAWGAAQHITSRSLTAVRTGPIDRSGGRAVRNGRGSAARPTGGQIG
jgi:hypothetical protein